MLLGIHLRGSNVERLFQALQREGWSGETAAPRHVGRHGAARPVLPGQSNTMPWASGSSRE
ncbi:hypothetical protein D3C85_390820 [compost metagenome]